MCQCCVLKHSLHVTKHLHARVPAKERLLDRHYVLAVEYSLLPCIIGWPGCLGFMFKCAWVRVGSSCSCKNYQQNVLPRVTNDGSFCALLFCLLHTSAQNLFAHEMMVEAMGCHAAHTVLQVAHRAHSKSDSALSKL